MYYIIYLSTAKTWFSSEDLQQIMSASEANNRRAGITGLLLYADGNFI